MSNKRIQKNVKMAGVGRGNNPASRKNLHPRKHLSEKQREAVGRFFKDFYSDETKHPNWLGQKAGYRSLHKWVQKWLGKPSECSMCGKNGTGHQIHWANVSGKYLRDLTDWMRLCAKCHKMFDMGRTK